MINEIDPETVNTVWIAICVVALLLEVGVQAAIYFEDRRKAKGDK